MPQLSTGDGFPDVVVTGIAMMTALATDADNTWKKLLDGQSGIRKLDDPFIEQFDLPVRIGGHLLEDFDHELTRVELHRYLFLQKMSTRVGRRVWANAGSPEVDTNRLMVSIGTGIARPKNCPGQRRDRERASTISQFGCAKAMPNAAAAAVRLRGAKAGSTRPVSACASGAEAIA
jgi:beta-ketoacyl ACP synthase